MNTPAPGIGEPSKARFEFRAFGQDFDAVHYRLGRLSVPVPEEAWLRRSDETYLVSRADDRHSVKLRADALDIKVLVRTFAGLEQWDPMFKVGLPLPQAVVRKELRNALHVELPGLPDGPVTADELVAAASANPALAVAQVQKTRHGYLVDDTICEYALVLVNGARLVTVSVEALDAAAVLRVVRAAGMSGLENVSYVRAIKRVLGMAPPAATTG